MAYTYRPDLLPFAVPTRIGLPYHGLVTNAQLPLPGGQTKAYNQPSGGHTHMVQHPKNSTPPADSNPHYQWADYAILSGRSREIGGAALGENNWIYCDAECSWRMSVSYTSTFGSTTLSVWLEDVFGLVKDADTAMTRRLLTTYTVIFKNYDGSNNSAKVAAGLHLTHSRTGNVTAVNIFGSGTTYAQTAGICHSFKITISGNGSLVAGEIGGGISASCVELADAPDMIVTTNSTSGTVGDWYNGGDLATDWTTTASAAVYTPSADCGALGPGTHLITCQNTWSFIAYPQTDPTSGSYSVVYTKKREYFYCVTPAGSLVHVTEDYSSTKTESGDVTGSLVGGTTVEYENKFNWPCPPPGASYVSSRFTGNDNISSLLTGVISITNIYNFSFGAYSKNQTYSVVRTRTSGYTFTWVLIAPDPPAYEPSFIGDYTFTNSDTGPPAAPSWIFPETAAPIVIKTNNVILFTGANENRLVSILGDSTVSGDAYVSWHPVAKTFATSNTAEVCYV